MSAEGEDKIVIVHADDELDAAWLLKRAAAAVGCPVEEIFVSATSDMEELRTTLLGASQVVVVLSEALLRTHRLPRLLEGAAKKGARIGALWFSHCDYTNVLGELEILHDPRLLIDSFPENRRAPIYAQAAERLRHLQIEPDLPAVLPALEETGFGVPIAFLGAAVEARQKRMALNRQVAGYLVWISLALIGLGVLFWVLQAEISLPLMLVLGALSFLSVAIVLNFRNRALSESSRTLSYMRSGLLDPRLPTRQSAPLLQRTAELPGMKYY